MLSITLHTPQDEDVLTCSHYDHIKVFFVHALLSCNRSLIRCNNVYPDRTCSIIDTIPLRVRPGRKCKVSIEITEGFAHGRGIRSPSRANVCEQQRERIELHRRSACADLSSEILIMKSAVSLGTWPPPVSAPSQTAPCRTKIHQDAELQLRAPSSARNGRNASAPVPVGRFDL